MVRAIRTVCCPRSVRTGSLVGSVVHEKLCLSCVDCCSPVRLQRSAKSVVRRTSPQIGPPQKTPVTNIALGPSSAACILTYTTESNTGGSGSCPIQARSGRQKILAELLNVQRRIKSRWLRSFAKEPPLTIPTGPQHKITAFLQGQRQMVISRQLCSMSESSKARLEKNV